MSAIAGINYLNQQPIEREKLARMVDILKHRGGDGGNIWHQGSIGFGHQMLWTTPESLREKLPAAKGKLAITADARLDNREELIPALGLAAYPTEEISDSDLILAAYEKWGELCSERLLGDFAFAIWDGRNHSLFCARDYFGVRPFYYYYHPGKLFTFASEIKSLLCLGEVPRRLNEVRIGDYLEVMLEDKAITFYQDILRLPPAHSLTVSLTGIKLREYWSLDPKYELKLNSDREYAEAYLEVFTKAVRCRLRSAFPIGSALSGGLDSSSIVCIAREHLQQPLKTFSGIFESVPESDERPFINAVVEQGGVEPHYVKVDRISPLVDIEKVLWHQDEPFFAPNLFLNWGMYRSVKQQGVRIFLDGFVGDSTVFHGTEYLLDLARSWQWLNLAKQVKSLARVHDYDYSAKKLMRYYLWDCTIQPKVPDHIMKLWYKLKNQKPPESNRLQLSKHVNSSFAKQIDLIARINSFQPDDSLFSAREYHHQYITTGEITFGLEVANKLASAFSLESRFPFTDRRLAEFCLAVPPQQKLHNGLTRVIVRRALINHLPKKVSERSDKGDLSHNFTRGLLNFEKERLEEFLLHNPQIIAKYTDISFLSQVYQRYLDDNSVKNVRPIWLAVTLGLWLRYTNLLLKEVMFMNER
ncbi:MAG: lasso peptide isopeptide bond-forming cyclase [Cyanobacteria bacterium P01_A01_bin.83]